MRESTTRLVEQKIPQTTGRPGQPGSVEELAAQQAKNSIRYGEAPVAYDIQRRRTIEDSILDVPEEFRVGAVWLMDSRGNGDPRKMLTREELQAFDRYPTAADAQSGPWYLVLNSGAQKSMGSVHTAFNTKTRQTVLMKFFEPQKDYDSLENARARHLFRNEIQLTAKLGSKFPNIVPVLDLLHNEQLGDVMITKYMDPKKYSTLVDVLKEGKNGIAAGKALFLTQRLANVLSDIWKKYGILHFDLSARNILIPKDTPALETEPYLIDFGFSGISREKSITTEAILEFLIKKWRRRHGDHSLEMTPDELAFPAEFEDFIVDNLPVFISPQDFLGTLAYLSPERVMNKADAARPAGEVFALGAILFYELTGTRLFEGGGTTDVINDILFKDVSQKIDTTIRLVFNKQNIPAAVADQVILVLQKAVSKDWQDRYQTLEDFAKALPSLPYPEAGQTRFPWLMKLKSQLLGQGAG